MLDLNRKPIRKILENGRKPAKTCDFRMQNSWLTLICWSFCKLWLPRPFKSTSMLQNVYFCFKLVILEKFLMFGRCPVNFFSVVENRRETRLLYLPIPGPLFQNGLFCIIFVLFTVNDPSGTYIKSEKPRSGSHTPILL